MVALLLRVVVVGVLVSLCAKLAFGGFLGGIASLESRLGSHMLALGIMLAAVLALFLKSLRVGLWLFYRPVPSPESSSGRDALPTVTAIVPAYNEGAMVRHALLSLAGCDYPKDKLQIIAVDDGSRDDTYVHMQAAARLHPGRILLLRLPRNQGKRAALLAGFTAARSELVLTVDSDCILSPDAVHHMVAPFADRKVGAVAGRVVVHNRKGSWLTRLLSPQFTLTFDFLRAAQSVNGTVLCCPGALSAYRLAVVRQVLPRWIDQRFRGTRVGPGEDRYMTTLILREGYRSRYQRTARVHTLVPTAYRKMCKMFLRWDRSDLRESLEALRLQPKRSGWSRLSLVVFLGSALETLASVPLTVLGSASLVAMLIASPATALMALLGLNLSTGLSLLLCLSSDFAPETCLLWFYAWFGPAISWIRPYASVTLKDQAWGSRSLPVVQTAPARARAVA
jgi:hyaluronan synthase